MRDPPLLETVLEGAQRPPFDQPLMPSNGVRSVALADLAPKFAVLVAPMASAAFIRRRRCMAPPPCR